MSPHFYLFRVTAYIVYLYNRNGSVHTVSYHLMSHISSHIHHTKIKSTTSNIPLNISLISLHITILIFSIPYARNSHPFLHSAHINYT